MRVLIAYGTTDGMTARIADRMAQTLRTAGHAVEVHRTDARRAPDLAGFDAVLVGGSLHAGGFQRSMRRFVRRNLQTLRRVPSGFFSVCMAIASKHERSREDAREIARALPRELGWAPLAVEVIAGALMFSRYGFLRRLIMVKIARKEMGEIDTRRDHVFTDWAAVDRFALEFVEKARRKGSGTAEVTGSAPRSTVKVSGKTA
jgi:menaquinone-dependent protoporphyrinogen oxidase